MVTLCALAIVARFRDWFAFHNYVPYSGFRYCGTPCYGPDLIEASVSIPPYSSDSATARMPTFDGSHRTWLAHPDGYPQSLYGTYLPGFRAVVERDGRINDHEWTTAGTVHVVESTVSVGLAHDCRERRSVRFVKDCSRGAVAYRGTILSGEQWTVNIRAYRPVDQTPPPRESPVGDSTQTKSSASTFWG